MSIDDKINWSKTTWEGSRREQLKSSLKLTPKQRFEALEEMAETGRWLAGMGKRHAEKTLAVGESKTDYYQRALGDNKHEP